jgi:heptosyltransferase-2
VEDGDGLRHHIPQGGFPRLRRSRIKLETCRNILVVKLDFIGDWVLTTPFLENVRLNAPKAKITAVVLDRAFDLASACPFVDRVISVSDAVGRRTIFGAASVGALAGFRRDIEDGAFDLALVPRWDVDFNGAILVAHGSRAKRIAGFTEASTKRKATVNRGDDRFYTDLVADPRSVHEVEHKLALVEAVGGRVLSRRASAHFTEADGAHAGTFLSDRFGRGPAPVLAVAPFVADPKRVFPLPRLAAIVDALAARHGFRIVVLGSPSHRNEAESFAGRLAAPAASAAGLMRTRESAALTALSAAFLGMDSGPGHIAAAVGTPTAVISCHPKTGHPDHVNSPVRFAPWGEAGRILVIQPDRAVDPCRDGCQAGEAHCIASLSDDRLIADISAFFSRFFPAR